MELHHNKFITLKSSLLYSVGLGTVFADNVYEVDSAVSISTSVSGISTYVRRVFAKVNQFNYGFSGITTSDFFGSFSWGRIETILITYVNMVLKAVLPSHSNLQ